MATRHPLDGSEPVADGRASIAGCRTDKFSDCHDSLLPTHSRHSARTLFGKQRVDGVWLQTVFGGENVSRNRCAER